jgi:hypothetical protein
MTEVDLRKIKTYIITVDKYKDRQIKIIQELKSIGLWNYELVRGKESIPYWVWHKESIREILDKNKIQESGPFLILEDDASIIKENFDPIVSFHNRTDMVYLGGTLNGIKSNGPKDSTELAIGDYFGLRYKEVDEKWIRVFNMHSNHAMLFIKETSKNKFKESLKEKSPADVCFASIMKDTTTYLIKKPYWFQNDGKNDIATKYYYPPEVFRAAEKELYKYWFPRRNVKKDGDRVEMLNIIHEINT